MCLLVLLSGRAARRSRDSAPLREETPICEHTRQRWGAGPRGLFICSIIPSKKPHSKKECRTATTSSLRDTRLCDKQVCGVRVRNPSPVNESRMHGKDI